MIHEQLLDDFEATDECLQAIPITKIIIYIYSLPCLGSMAFKVSQEMEQLVFLCQGLEPFMRPIKYWREPKYHGALTCVAGCMICASTMHKGMHVLPRFHLVKSFVRTLEVKLMLAKQCTHA
jgi:hypothetical protein